MMLGDATKLLDEFSKVPGQIERPQTFMDIAKYPHRESVCNNILAFFMDPAESHGLGTLVLDALASAGGIVGTDEKVGRIISIEREATTYKGKRIDLLIKTDAHVILVENKIHARSDNPFDDYAAYLDQIAEGREPHKILLTLSRNYAGRECGFKNLTHDKFVGQMRSKLGHHVTGADTRYLTLLLDFLNTLENLKRGTRMDKEFVRLLANREEQVGAFLEGIESLKAEMQGKVQELGKRIKVERQNVKQLKSWQDPTVPCEGLPHSIRVPKGLVIQVDTNIFPKGWEIWIYPLEGSYFEMRDFCKD